MLVVRGTIIAAATAEERENIALALDNEVPTALWDGIARNIRDNSTEDDPHELIALKMFPDCVSIQYYRPARTNDPYRAISYLVN